ncbi:hypothetical protein [Polyangium jinanense]|uniref:Uncharacterized protein n=1 Tax=Polyangium jinanense TaxID=2829994 RepID=A0A9X3XCA1_9BACT|nr:hypothetical protein [Polyangium jinanense]MDC3960514.1 hypothetical protein [Polyangium jinanense]MDC3985376.1 hypothetical protein [Polyangium jinanense]
MLLAASWDTRALLLVTLLLGCTHEDASRATPSDAAASAPSSPPSAVVTPAPSPAPSPAPPPSAAPPNADTGAAEIQSCDPEKPPPIPSPDTRLYATWRTFPVDLGAHGGAGKLRVLEDSRLTRPGAVRVGTHPVLPPCDLLPSRVELIDEKGTTLQVERFWPELDVELRTMGPGAVLIETIERVRCLASCWCGDGHAFFRIQDGRLVPHEGRVVERRPAAGTPGVGAMLKAKPVTHGCYESSSIEAPPGRPPVLVVNRTAMGSFVTAQERHWFEDGAWKASIVERK